MIYFVRRSNGDIKIGTSVRMSARLKQLAAKHGRLDILGVCNGGLPKERLIHRKFHDFALGGEWFVNCESIRDFIETETEFWDGVDEAPYVWAIRLELSKEDHARVKEVSKYLGIPMAAFCRMALMDRVREEKARVKE